MIELSVMVLSAFLQASLPPVRSLDKGAMSGVDTARQVSVRTADQWEALWREHGSPRQRPAVDFSKELVVAVFMGTRSTAGFATEIVGYRSAGPGLKDVIVEYRETVPSRDSITAQILTAPHHIAVIPKQAGTVTFEKQK